jgi:hypothetical protein
VGKCKPAAYRCASRRTTAANSDASVDPGSIQASDSMSSKVPRCVRSYNCTISSSAVMIVGALRATNTPDHGGQRLGGIGDDTTEKLCLRAQGSDR